MSSVFFRLIFEAKSLGLHGKARLSFYVGTGPRTQTQCISLSLGMGASPGTAFMFPSNQNGLRPLC